MSSSDNMQITAQGLLKISRELINKRIYDSSKITLVGTPSITDGIASGLSEESYLQYNDLSFQSTDTLNFHFKGTFKSHSTFSAQSCAFNLCSSVLGYQSLSVTLLNNRISLNIGTTELAFISNLNIKDNASITIDLGITSTSYVLTLINNGISQSIAGTFTSTFELSKYTYILIGNLKYSSNQYWEGTIDLPEFSILKNNVMYYTPSIENMFSFSKVLVGDGTFPLVDSSTAILNHVYEFPVTELHRSGNNILIAATMDSSVHLKINQIGLYSVAADGTQLFALMDNLSINKRKDIGYDIVFHVNIDLEVVNTNLYPTVVLTEPEYISTKDFLTIKNVHTNDVVDMERAVLMNSTELGYNAAQTFCREQDKISMWEQNCTGVSTYRRVKEKFKYSESYTFNPDSITKVGNPSVTSDGILSGFSTSNYATTSGATIAEGAWSLKFSFTTGTNIITNKSVLMSSSTGTNRPIDIYVYNGKLYITLSEHEVLYVSDGASMLTYFRTGSTKVSGDTTYYMWKTEDTSYTNTSIYTTDVSPTVSSKYYDEDLVELSGWSFSKFESGKIFSNVLLDINHLTKYYISIEYDGFIYYIKYSMDGENYTLLAQRVYNVLAASFDDLVFGVRLLGSTSNAFDGTIDLMDFELITTGSTHVLYNTTKMQTQLLDMFYIPEYLYSAYKVNNLNNDNSKIEIVEGSINGYGDSIDFGNSTGFTLSLKVYLQDGEDKVILAKTDEDNEDEYFKLEYSNNKLTFTLFTETHSVVLEKELDSQTLRGYTDNPILITIVRDENQYSPSYKMYKNNMLIAQVDSSFSDFLDADDYPKLTNYLSADTIDEAQNYIQGIYTFSGPVSTEQLYYLTNATDTNFDDTFVIEVYPATGHTLSDISTLNIIHNNVTIATLTDFITSGNKLKYTIKGVERGEYVTITSLGYESETFRLLDATKQVILTVDG